MYGDKTRGKDSKLTIKILMSKSRRDETDTQKRKKKKTSWIKRESVFYTQTSGKEERER
jgi:hypothetical protein